MTESYLPDKKSPNYHLYPWHLNWGRLAKSFLQPRNPYSLNWKKIYDQFLSPNWETISELSFISLVPDEKTDCDISKWKLCLRYLSCHWCLKWGKMDKSIFELSLYLIKLSFYRWSLSGRKFGKPLLPCWNFISGYLLNSCSLNLQKVTKSYLRDDILSSCCPFYLVLLTEKESGKS